MCKFDVIFCLLSLVLHIFAKSTETGSIQNFGQFPEQLCEKCGVETSVGGTGGMQITGRWRSVPHLCQSISTTDVSRDSSRP